LTSVLRPGTFLTCAAFASTNSNSPSERMCQTGFQYTPVASITRCVQPSTDSHSDKAISPLVVVLNDRTSLFTSPSTKWRTQATTESL